MKSIPVLLICFFIALNTYSQQATIKAIEFRDSTIGFGETFYRVFHKGPYIVYQSQYHSEGSESRPKFDSSTNDTTLETTTLWSELRDQFFVFHKDSSFGYQYDPHDSSNDNRRLPVDTVVKKIKSSNDYENLLPNKPDSIAWSADKTELREVYVGDPGKAKPRTRLVLYYSGNMSHIKESMNPAMDSAKKMKLYRVEILTDEFYSETDSKLWPPMKILSTEMKEIELKDSIEVVSYLNRYKKSIGK